MFTVNQNTFLVVITLVGILLENLNGSNISTLLFLPPLHANVGGLTMLVLLLGQNLSNSLSLPLLFCHVVGQMLGNLLPIKIRKFQVTLFQLLSEYFGTLIQEMGRVRQYQDLE